MIHLKKLWSDFYFHKVRNQPDQQCTLSPHSQEEQIHLLKLCPYSWLAGQGCDNNQVSSDWTARNESWLAWLKVGKKFGTSCFQTSKLELKDMLNNIQWIWGIWCIKTAQKTPLITIFGRKMKRWIPISWRSCTCLTERPQFKQETKIKPMPLQRLYRVKDKCSLLLLLDGLVRAIRLLGHSAAACGHSTSAGVWNTGSATFDNNHAHHCRLRLPPLDSLRRETDDLVGQFPPPTLFLDT